jgi:hypothetical protein
MPDRSYKEPHTKMFDVGGPQIRGAFKWQRDPTDVANYPMSPEDAYPEDKARQKRYLDFLIRLMQDENQFKDIVRTWVGSEEPSPLVKNSKIAKARTGSEAELAYGLNTDAQAAWAQRGRSPF